MVGVPGKYKGCETCRRRRVKCDNARPFCRKCVDNGRECEGYERQMVFITATLEDGGRCSSHPPRQVGSSGKKAKSQSPPGEERPQFFAEHPLRPSWTDLITLSRAGASQLFQIVAVNTGLQGVFEDGSGKENFSLEAPAYSLPDFPFYASGGELDIKGRCVVHLPSDLERDRGPGNLCMYLYEFGSAPLSPASANRWPSTADQTSGIKRRGPQSFMSFPAHHFFSRIYRPCAISAALLSRNETFLATPEWMTVPWEHHEKSSLDRLFDILALVPSILARSDIILSEPFTQIRQHRVQDLLAHCLQVEHQLDEWYAAVTMTATGPSWWHEEHDMQMQIPFIGSFAFIDGFSSIMFIYYWMGLLVFHRCIETLRLNLYHNVYPPAYGHAGLPQPNLAVDEYKYQQGRDLAGKICQSLDFALNRTLQPDLLMAPWWVAQNFYTQLSAATGDGTLEHIWCETFKERLIERGQYLTDLVQGRRWMDIGRF